MLRLPRRVISNNSSLVVVVEAVLVFVVAGVPVRVVEVRMYEVGSVVSLIVIEITIDFFDDLKQDILRCRDPLSLESQQQIL